jgi:hypothetical protein
MKLRRHPVVPHVLFGATNERGRLILHFVCERCGDRTDRPCHGGQGMPALRRDAYAKAHMVCSPRV